MSRLTDALLGAVDQSGALTLHTTPTAFRIFNLGFAIIGDQLTVKLLIPGHLKDYGRFTITLREGSRRCPTSPAARTARPRA